MPQVIANTPLWVWVLLAFLLFLGIRALRPATVPVWRAAILPVIFFAWGMAGLYALYGLGAMQALVWAAALGIGAGIGLVIAGLQPVRADKVRHLVQIPGGPLTLVLILLIFATKYEFGFLHATQPSLFAEPRIWLAEVAVSGLLAGMFVGRFAGLWRQYRAGPHEDLAA
jgi:hypothetical protein